MTGNPATKLRWVMGLTSAAYFMVVRDALVVVTALPRMQRDLHVGVSSLQWTVNAYRDHPRDRLALDLLDQRPDRTGSCLLGRQFLPESYGSPERLDLAGVSLVTAGVVALVWALTRASAVGWGSAEIVGSLAAGSALLVAFLWWERRAAEPMVPPRLFSNREFAIGNLTTYLLHGATFAAAFFITQEFQLARGYSPLGTGLRLLPFFATPMIVSPLAGALSDRIGRRPIMVAGLGLQALGYVWVAARGSLATSWIELDVALLVAGIGISMALPTVPTAVLDAVAPEEMGKASGVNYMSQRLGTVFALAIASAVFAAHGHLGSPPTVTAGFRPALWTCACFVVLAELSGIAITTA